MSDQLILLLIVTLAAALFAGIYLRRVRRRQRLLGTPLSSQQRDILASRVPFFRKLPEQHRDALEGLINRFLSEITFVGRDGLEITEEIKLVIAAQACLLIVNRPKQWFPTLHTVLVYPSAFRSKTKQFEGYVERDDERARSGESWLRGPVVLAWDHAVRGALIDDDGHNVVMHEFAHQLDKTTGVADGAPHLSRDQSAVHWAKVFQEAFSRLQNDVGAARQSVFDPYGATSPAEFFAVAVETFFEKPSALQSAEPDLYEQLTVYFALDPARWPSS